MNILFIGTVDFSFHALQKLVDLKATIVGVITKIKSSFHADFHDLKPICENENIPYKYVKDINAKENLNWIKSKRPDIIFCFGWSQLLKKELLNIPHMGIVGYHPAALPYNRGRHPIIWALCLGLKETGSTFFFMDEGADSGDILSQKVINISKDDNAGTLYLKTTNIALKQIDEFLPLLMSGNYLRAPQNHSLSNTWRKRGIEDGKIDWRMNAENIHNLVRSLTHPYIGAHFVLEGREIKVWDTTIGDPAPENLEPGKVLSIQDGIAQIKCGSGTILLNEVEPPNKLKINEYLK